MAMPGRKFNASGEYRYGFNGKELDTDMDGNNYDYGFRIYNPLIGRFLSVDPLQKKYPWYTPYQFAGNDVIRNSDLDGKEPWLRNTIETISKNRSGITAVSASFTAEEFGVLSVARGMAVDPKGNVLIFDQKGGLAALQFGFSTNAGLGVSANYTWYNNGVPSLKSLLGGGSSGGSSKGWKTIVSFGVGDEYQNGENVGSTISIGLGYSALPIGGVYQQTNTTGIILTGPEYDKVYNDNQNAIKQANSDMIDYNSKQADGAGVGGTFSYSRALYQSEWRGMSTNYVPVDGKKDIYEITYSYNLWKYANHAVNPGGKDQIESKTFKTGVEVQKDKDGNYISTNYKQ